MSSYTKPAALCSTLILLLHSSIVPSGSKEIARELKPTASMPMWFYHVRDEFRYPVPCEFDFAYIDKSGKVKITGPFVKATSFQSGKAKVSLGIYRLNNDKWTLQTSRLDPAMQAKIDKDGKIEKLGPLPSGKTRITISSAGHFELGPAANKIAQALDSQLKTKKKPENLKPFMDKSIHKWGYNYADGTNYIPAKLDAAGEFKDGISLIKMAFSGKLQQKRNAQIEATMKKAEKDSTNTSSDTKKAIAEYNHFSTALGTIAYITKRGDFIVPLDIYQDGRDFSEGIAAVYKDKAWGYIDTTGKVIIEPQYENARSYRDGLAAVFKDNKYGYIDKNNKTIIPFKFALAQDFENGLAPASEDGKTWGYIDKSGKFKIQPQFKRALPFKDGMALVLIPPIANPENNPEEANNFYTSGLMLMRMNEPAQAREAFKVSTKLQPKTTEGKVSKILLDYFCTPDTPVNQAQKLYKKGRESQNLDLRMALFKRTLKASPEFAWAKVRLAEALIEKGDKTQALKILEDVSNKKPNFMPATIQLATLYGELNQPQKEAQTRLKVKGFSPEPAVFKQFKQLIPPKYY